jgi:hypothetical protein
MVDAVDSFLNNAVDLYVQAVDYCRISTSQIPTPVGAGIRQIKPESGDVQQMSPDSGYLAGSGCSGRISGRFPVNLLGCGRYVPDSGKVRRNPAKMAGFRQLLREFVYAKF